MANNPRESQQVDIHANRGRQGQGISLKQLKPVSRSTAPNAIRMVSEAKPNKMDTMTG